MAIQQLGFLLAAVLVALVAVAIIVLPEPEPSYSLFSAPCDTPTPNGKPTNTPGGVTKTPTPTGTPCQKPTDTLTPTKPLTATVTPTVTSNRPTPNPKIEKTVNGVQGPITVTQGDSVVYRWAVTNAGDRPFFATIDDDVHDALDGVCLFVSGETCEQSAEVILLTPGPITNTSRVEACGIPPWPDFCDFGLDQDSVTVNVVTATPTKQPSPGDTDHDGCSDVQENQPKANANQGGGRDYLDFWDVFDTDTENGLNAGTALAGAVATTDIFAVAGHFGDTGDPGIDPLSDASGAGYHTRFDRGDIIGANNWNRAPADGAIAITDIFAVAAQFGLDCS